MTIRSQEADIGFAICWAMGSHEPTSSDTPIDRSCRSWTCQRRIALTERRTCSRRLSIAATTPVASAGDIAVAMNSCLHQHTDPLRSIGRHVPPHNHRRPNRGAPARLSGLAGAPVQPADHQWVPPRSACLVLTLSPAPKPTATLWRRSRAPEASRGVDGPGRTPLWQRRPTAGFRQKDEPLSSRPSKHSARSSAATS